MCDILLFSRSFILIQQLFSYIFLWIFYLQVGANRTCPNSKPKVHIGLDLLFADLPENLRVPGISLSSSDVP